MTHGRQLRHSPRTALVCALGAALIGASADLIAADTDIAEVPLASSSSVAVKPNIFYLLDDSGSMNEDAMPDEMASQDSKVTYRNHLCNTIYYNPAVFYPAPPKTAAGKRFADQSFILANTDGYAATGAVNLSTGFRANGGDTAQPAYYYVLSAGTAPASPLAAECRGSAPAASAAFPHSATGGGLTWTKVQVGPTSGINGSDERTNFANWYGFYRTRLMMMKAATGRSFVALSSSYRVGFLTINPYVAGVLTTKYLRIADFDSTHKQSFLDKLYSQSTNGATPLREALARAGWVYAGQLGSGLTTGIPAADDPVQYSCQQNFTLLTTDGYWNGNRGLDLLGNPVGNQDGDITEQKTAGDPARTVTLSARPIYDSGATSTETTTTTTNTYFYSTLGCSSNRRRIRYNSTVTQRVLSYSGTVLVSDQTTTNTTTNNLAGGNCSSNPPPLPSPNPSTTVTNATAGASGGSFNSLADVAQYYYKTDLRPSMPDNVREAGQGIEDDRAPWQHMTTFTMGLGIFGQLNFISNYRTNPDPSTDFNKLRIGALNWPAPTDSTAIFNEPAKADDLWHAAVNGRGVAFNASSPDSVVVGLQQALASMNAIKASAAAAATSNLEPVAGDNFAYTASYETVKWQGELQAREIDLATGLVGETPVWSAQAKLDTLVRDACDTRTIHLFRSGAAGNLVPFKWNTDTCNAAGAPSGAPVTTLDAQEQGFFTDITVLSHYPQMTDGLNLTVDQRTPAAGANLVNYLRGHRGKETFISNSINRLYRARERILGDIVNAQPVFVRQPFANYTDTGYDAFKSAYASRTPMVYVAANDGMLHAFYAGTSTTDPQGGQEAWAFIPTMVLPNLRYLADDNYANLHRFFVDGTPVAGDIFDANASQWKTILVGGLNKGGQGYYALDITDPANPKALWEFKVSGTCFDPLVPATRTADCNLGFTYGNPLISKLKDGTWVVFVTSGYNNNKSSSTTEGQGFLYVLNAATGEIIKKIGTGVGDSLTPSGLGKINNWVDDGLSNNTADRVYGVDLLGNLWRFDVNGAAASGSLAQLVTTFRDAALPGGQPQSITTKPELAVIGGRPFVFVATGRYLGTGDIDNAQVQTLYALSDPLTTTTPSNTIPLYLDVRTGGSLQQVAMSNTVIGGAAARTAACIANCGAADGWFVDFPEKGERVNVDMKLQLGTLTVLSNVPGNSACTTGGFSFINFFDYTSGLPVSTTTGMVSLKLADSLAVGLNIVRLPSGKTVAIGTTSDSKQRTTDVPISSPGLLGRRVSWRELME